jgi:hypothetical protein
MPEQAGADAGAVEATAAPLAPEAAAEPGLDARAESPSIAPDHEAPKADAPESEAPMVEPPRIVMPKVEPKAEVKAEVKPEIETEAKAETKAETNADTKPEPKPGKLIVMASSDRSWDREEFAPHVKPEPKQETGSTRRLSAMAAVIALASVVGAISGALATVGVMHVAANQAAPVQVADNSAMEASIARIDADVVALKAGLDHTAKSGVSQFNKANDRLDKLEKAQAEPMAKLAKLSEAVDKLRATQAAAPAQATAAKDVTGSIAPAQVAAATPGAPPQTLPAQAAALAAASSKVEVGRLPTVEGWRLRDVSNGGALIEGRSGLYEVYAGDPVPGLGRIDAIRRQDGHWVVVTSKGLIVAR